MSKLNLVFSILVTSLLVFPASCVSNEVQVTDTYNEQEQSENEWGIGSDKYVFIDHHIHRHGELIKGKCPILCIDFPTYRFDEEKNTLSGMIDFDVDEALKIVYGSGSSLSGYAGMGAATRLFGVYKLPYESNGFKIVKVEPDGTSHIEYNNASIILNSGEKWVNTISRVNIQQYEDKPCEVKLTITDTIVNYGILDKSKIERMR